MLACPALSTALSAWIKPRARAALKDTSWLVTAARSSAVAKVTLVTVFIYLLDLYPAFPKATQVGRRVPKASYSLKTAL